MKKKNESQAKKGFFAKLMDKIDKKFEEKAKSGCCCNDKDNTGKKSCCS